MIGRFRLIFRPNTAQNLPFPQMVQIPDQVGDDGIEAGDDGIEVGDDGIEVGDDLSSKRPTLRIIS